MSDLEKVSEGAATLLGIAIENDREAQLASNSALEESLQDLAELPPLCRDGGEAALCERLGVTEPPASLIGFCALLVNQLDLRIQRAEKRAWSRASDFDHGVFLALAQTLAEAARKGRREPDFRTLCRRIGAADPAELQERMIANYVGNLLQDHFDACKVRFEVPGLPPDTEERLRHDDGQLLARAVFEGREGAAGGARADDILRRFDAVLRKLTA